MILWSSGCCFFLFYFFIIIFFSVIKFPNGAELKKIHDFVVVWLLLYYYYYYFNVIEFPNCVATNSVFNEIETAIQKKK